MNHRSVLMSTFLMACALGAAACGTDAASSGESARDSLTSLDWSDLDVKNPVGNYARIVLLNDKNDASTPTGPEYNVSLEKLKYGDDSKSQHCRVATAGSCQIAECGPSFPPNLTSIDPDVGTIEISGGTISPSFVLPVAYYLDAERKGWAWQGGEAIRFNASGKAGSGQLKYCLLLAKSKGRFQFQSTP